MFIESKKVCVKPLRNRLEAIQKLQPPKTPKGCRSFAGIVNFLSMFCPELQKLLKPIYDFNKKRETISLGKRTTGFIYRNKAQISKASGTAYAKQDREISFVLLTQVSMQPVVHYIKYRVVSPN